MKKEEAIEVLHIALELTKETLNNKVGTASGKGPGGAIKTETIFDDCVKAVHENYKKLTGSE